jgi:phenylalanyl-tRNA synthetase beta chain
MKVSLNWVKKMTGISLGLNGLVDVIGQRLGEVEEVQSFGRKYKGVLVVKVESVEKHPDADKLHVCLVDDGRRAKDVERNEHGLVQVVCGAPNVKAGMMAVWLPPGVTVPSTADTQDPFVMEARDLRGQKSNGMLASPKELALGDSHEGILEIDAPSRVGQNFAQVYELDDQIIDIENKMFTHRPDCFGHLGVAREIAGISGQQFHSPAWYKKPTTPQTDQFGGQSSDNKDEAEKRQSDPFRREGSPLQMTVDNQLPDLVQRFMAVGVRGVSVGLSPILIQSYLLRVGIRPINNVVDITNYMMMLTGQPLHAYDYDKVKEQDKDSVEAKLVVRQPKEGEKLALLNGKTVDLLADDIVIASNTKPIGLGGVMGGANTEVDKNTKNVILECATFDMYAVRRTSMVHGLFSDAVTRFNKGQSPLQPAPVLEETLSILKSLAGGQIATNLHDDFHFNVEAKNHGSLVEPILITPEFIEARLGKKFAPEDIKKTLENVEFSVETTEKGLRVSVPFWRTDIAIAEDIVEEVGRLNGYDSLPLDLPWRRVTPTPRNELLAFKSRIRQLLAAGGANEVLTYSFVDGDLLQKTGQSPKGAFKLKNALSPELQYFRESLTPSLLQHVRGNIKSGFSEFALFEIGKGHNTQHVNDDDGLPGESQRLALVYAAKNPPKDGGAAFYRARKFLEYLVAECGVVLGFSPVKEDGHAGSTYDNARTAIVSTKTGGQKTLGMLGEFTPAARRNLKLPDYCAGFEVNLALLHEAFLARQNPYAELPKFPPTVQDISLKMPANKTYAETRDVLEKALKTAQPEHSRASLTPHDIFQRDNDSEHKQLTFRLNTANYHRTLTDQEVNNLLDELAAAAKDALGAERI